MEEHIISFLYYPEGHMPCDEYAAILEERGLAPMEHYFSIDDTHSLHIKSSVNRHGFIESADVVWLDSEDSDLFEI
jgi:hypothetical protein